VFRYVQFASAGNSARSRGQFGGAFTRTIRFL
jgi:hypothetical protein